MGLHRWWDNTTLVSKFAVVNPAPLGVSLHYSQVSVVAKLYVEIKKVMATVTRLVNFVQESCSLQHCLLRALLEEMSAEHKDLLLSNDACWLVKAVCWRGCATCTMSLSYFYPTLQSQKGPKFSELFT